MASLRDIRRRIGSVKNTRKITRAMKLVAGAKMRKAEQAAKAAQPYQHALKSMLSRVVATEDSIEHELLNTPKNSKDIVIVVHSSNRGLCGSFNAQINKHAVALKKQYEAEGKNVKFIVFGKKVAAVLKGHNAEMIHQNLECKPEDFVETSHDLAEKLIGMLNNNEFSKVILCYNKFVNTITQEAQDIQILPMQLEDSSEDVEGVEYLYEPNGQALLGDLLPRSLRPQLLQAFLDTEAGEQAARMQAMDNATNNASDMIDRLSLEYNRARQAAITTELTEIISGAEAL